MPELEYPRLPAVAERGLVHPMQEAAGERDFAHPSRRVVEGNLEQPMQEAAGERDFAHPNRRVVEEQSLQQPSLQVAVLVHPMRRVRAVAARPRR